jgi:beta-lactamase superfamily II metal-dependent hydrolase
MEIKIFKVEHGFCSFVIADNGNVMLIDCGYNSTTGFTPSEYLRKAGFNGIEYLAITNFDEDHVADLKNIRRFFPITVVYSNRSVSATILRSIKEQSGPISSAMDATIALLEHYSSDIFSSPSFSRIKISTYSNRYPNFTDTNNLSLVIFLTYYDFSIIYPGDLEKPGWRALLEDYSFRNALRKVNVFVASHHGRESGYCEDVFRYCSPDIVVISDTSIQYQTQETKYQNHAKGVSWEGGGNRYVLTTRNDGLIKITKDRHAPSYITTDK